MTQTQANDLPNGVYILYWNFRGTLASVASVGRTSRGDAWFCPANWTTGPSSRWQDVDHVEVIMTTQGLYERMDMDYTIRLEIGMGPEE